MNRTKRFDAFSQVEGLEPRVLLANSLVYQAFADLVGPVTPEVLANGYRGPLAVVGDLNADGVPDLLVGNSGVTGAPPVDASGAAILSGATGAVIRTHTRADARFGWYVAALGDVNADGTNDYGIGCGIGTGASTAFVYSGATGALLLTLAGNDPTGGATIAGLSDLTGDGRADVLVGFIGENRAVVFSGANGVQVTEHLGADLGGDIGRMGLGVGGGADFNNDGTMDYIVAAHRGMHAGTGADPFQVVLNLYSGASGGLIRSINSEQVIPTGAIVPALTFDTREDFNDDGIHEIVFAVGNRVGVLDPTDGTPVVIIQPSDSGAVQSAVNVGDLDKDGTPDVAVGIPNRLNSEVAGQAGAVAVYSGATGGRLSLLTDNHTASANSRMGAWIAFGGDLDGDGITDLVAVGDQNPGGTPVGPGRVFLFSGATLVTPVPDGISSDANENVLAWGSVGNRGYIIYHNQPMLVADLAGFAGTDRIFSIAPAVGGGWWILGASNDIGSNPFVWHSGPNFNDGTRTNIAGFTEVNAPPGNYVSVLGRGVNSSGDVLVYRLRQGFGATTWIWDREGNTMTFLFDGAPLAINGPGNVLGLNADANSTQLWTSGGGVQLIDGLLATDFNDSNVVVGQAQRPGDTSHRTYIWNAGTFTAVPDVAGGQELAGRFINESGVVLGVYRVTATFGISVFVYDPADMTTTDVKTLTDVDAPTSFVNATNFSIYGLSDAGLILGRLPATGTSFVLRPYTGEGPFIVDQSAIISSAALADGGIFVTTTNPAGEIVALYRSPLSAPWRRIDVTMASGAPRLTGDTVTWYDPQEDLIYIAAGSTSGLLLITQLGNGSWSVRNLTTEINGSEALVDSLVVLQPQSGMTIVGGLTAAGDLAIYGQSTATNQQGQVVWAYDNLFNSVIRAQGLPVPDFNTAVRGHLISYETSWDGLNIVGSDVGGRPTAIWTAPGITGWRVTDLSLSVVPDPNAAIGLTHLTAYITSWGGINVVGNDNLKVVWWVPQFGGEWRVASLQQVANGPMLRGETLSAYFAPWGGLNVAGLDEDGNLWIYWWTPANDVWTATNITARLHGETFLPVGNVSTLATPGGALNVYARAQSGDLLHYFWEPGAPDWTQTNVSLTAVS